MAKEIMRATYASASPYPQFWLEHYYERGFANLYGKRLKSARELSHALKGLPWIPEILLIGNFPHARKSLKATALEAGINVVHGEDGFFPHYETLHADPLGFCWESSLPGIKHTACSERQRQRAEATRQNMRLRQPGELPQEVRKPYVLWPLQLIGDQVNVCDLNLKSWGGLIRHFRGILPAKYQLAIKQHPRGQPHDEVGVCDAALELPNTVIVPKGSSLDALLCECSAVAGANSTVIYEARLIYHKPVYAYARSWFTNHEALFVPLRQDAHGLPNFDCVEDNRLLRTERLDAYAAWFLAQLLARQISRDTAQDPLELQKRVFRLSHEAYRKYGEEIFLD